jgi:hypothetical protein
MSLFIGEKTYKRKKNHVPWKGWVNKSPNYSQRIIMCKKCGKKCFLGKHNSFPICNKHTCKINKKGVWSAYIRSLQHSSKNKSYKKIASRARNIL